MKKISMCLVLFICSIIVLLLYSCGYNNGNIISSNTDESEYYNISENIISLDEFTSESNTVYITKGGIYEVSGSMNGQILIDVDPHDEVTLNLSNVEVYNESGPALLVRNGKSVNLQFAKGTENVFDSGEEYNITNENDLNADGTIFSRANLILGGEGSLKVNSLYKHAIVSKDTVTINGGSINVTSAKVGLEGKDFIEINGGNIKINSGSDSIRSTNEEDVNSGYIVINGGTIELTSDGDGISAITTLEISEGNINIISGGGAGEIASSEIDNRDFRNIFSPASEDDSTSMKGIKAGQSISVSGGTLTLDCADDAIHSNGTASVSGGSILISTGDDGIHADDKLLISGGDIEISKCYEGLEGASVEIMEGNISLLSIDDGINAASTASNSYQFGNQLIYDECYINISGGYIFVDSSGDGIDSNGNISITGGTILISGPTNDFNASIDYDGEAQISGGIFLATGSSGMNQGFSETSEQVSLMTNVSSVPSNTRVSLCNEEGILVISYVSPKSFNNVVASSTNFEIGEVYTIYIVGDASEADENGVAVSGTLNGGKVLQEVTITENMSSSIPMQPSEGMFGGGTPGGMPQKLADNIYAVCFKLTKSNYKIIYAVCKKGL